MVYRQNLNSHSTECKMYYCILQYTLFILLDEPKAENLRKFYCNITNLLILECYTVITPKMFPFSNIIYHCRQLMKIFMVCKEFFFSVKWIIVPKMVFHVYEGQKNRGNHCICINFLSVYFILCAYQSQHHRENTHYTF